MQKEIAVTGGAGFIGSSIAEQLSKKLRVKILDIKKPSANLPKLASFTQCDIRNYQDVKDALKDVDLVIHTAIVQIPQITENKPLSYEVNVLGTQNICRAVEENPKTKGMILSGSWHTIGERDLQGIIDEEFGFRPDKVEERARLYALSKMAQEAICRYYDEMSPKIYGILRMGTVLGEGMPRATAANIFIEKGLRGESLTPFKHSMYRPMLYVDIRDICKSYEIYANKILNDELPKSDSSMAHIVNVYYPQPITIFQLAEAIRDVIIECTNGSVAPKLEIVDKGLPPMFKEDDKSKITVNIAKAKSLLGMDNLRSPKESLMDIISKRTKEIIHQ